jgi:hypothetical protein
LTVSNRAVAAVAKTRIGSANQTSCGQNLNLPQVAKRATLAAIALERSDSLGDEGGATIEASTIVGAK